MAIKSLIRFLIPVVLGFGLMPAETTSQPFRPKTGIVLSGGGARGLAHIGVLKVLEEVNMPIDFIGGTSMGSIVGGLYASGYSANQLEEIAMTTDWFGLVSDESRRRYVPIPFVYIATDLETGDAIVIRSGSLAEAMRASMTLPTIFTPARVDGRNALDGGIVRNFPVVDVIDMGADISDAVLQMQLPLNTVITRGDLNLAIDRLYSL